MWAVCLYLSRKAKSKFFAASESSAAVFGFKDPPPQTKSRIYSQPAVLNKPHENGAASMDYAPTGQGLGARFGVSGVVVRKVRHAAGKKMISNGLDLTSARSI